MEIRVTVICFTILVLTGGILSIFFVLGKDLFFIGVSPYFTPRSYIMGFPTHYFLLIILGWFGPILIGSVWTLYMDKMEREIEAGAGIEEEIE